MKNLDDINHIYNLIRDAIPNEVKTTKKGNLQKMFPLQKKE